MEFEKIEFRGVLGFDLETNVIPTEDNHALEGVGITCVGIADRFGSLSWGSATSRFGSFTQADSDDLAQFLYKNLLAGTIPVSVNGLGFDFRVLHNLVSLNVKPVVRRLALNHIDIAFQCLKEKGFMLGMAAIAEGLGLTGKLEGMDGLKAVERWATCSELDRYTVLGYVKQDAVTTYQMHKELLNQRHLFWVTKRNTISRKPWRPLFIKGKRMLTAWEAIHLSSPDVSWMDEPWDPKTYYDWLEVDESKFIRFT